MAPRPAPAPGSCCGAGRARGAGSARSAGRGLQHHDRDLQPVSQQHRQRRDSVRRVTLSRHRQPRQPGHRRPLDGRRGDVLHGIHEPRQVLLDRRLQLRRRGVARRARPDRPAGWRDARGPGCRAGHRRGRRQQGLPEHRRERERQAQDALRVVRNLRRADHREPSVQGVAHEQGGPLRRRRDRRLRPRVELTGVSAWPTSPSDCSGRRRYVGARIVRIDVSQNRIASKIHPSALVPMPSPKPCPRPLYLWYSTLRAGLAQGLHPAAPSRPEERYRPSRPRPRTWEVRRTRNPNAPCTPSRRLTASERSPPP